MDDLLIIFVKNTIKGKVKTRLAQDIGDDQALLVYKRLLEKTAAVVSEGQFAKWVFYSDQIEENDLWEAGIGKKLQKGSDLGEKMANAFKDGFDANFRRICIIGSDCYELNIEIIWSAFDQLKTHDCVIGPANDGGYYLLGMTAFNDEVFEAKDWSTDQVFPQTLESFKSQNLFYHQLPELTDIDTLEDLQKFPQILPKENH